MENGDGIRVYTTTAKLVDRELSKVAASAVCKKKPTHKQRAKGRRMAWCITNSHNTTKRKSIKRRPVMQRTKIEWVRNPDGTQGFTYNPISGCLHACPYCYAKSITDRFAGRPFKTKFIENCAAEQVVGGNIEHVLLEYKPGFASPTFWCNRLKDPVGIKKPTTVFVCSMADMFGEWVPGIWIERILNTVKLCPQHTFLFLTKNGSKMCREGEVVDIENAWYGQTCTGVPDRPIVDIYSERQFLSFEPLLGDWVPDLNWIHTNWVIIGSLNRRGKAVHPNNGGTRKEWALKVIREAEKANKPTFIKSELLRLYPNLPQKKDIPYLKR